MAAYFRYAERVMIIVDNKLLRGLVVGGPRNGVDGEDVWLVEPRMGDFFPSDWVLQGQIARDSTVALHLRIEELEKRVKDLEDAEEARLQHMRDAEDL